MLTIRCPVVASHSRSQLKSRSRNRVVSGIVSGLMIALGCGCTSTKTTNTVRTATEQLLISNAIDQSLSKIDYTPMAGKKVLVEEKYLESIDKVYVASTVRHHVLQAGAALATKPEEADIILEIRSGGIGTDTSDSFLGVQGISVPGMLTLPDLKLVTRTRQAAYAKIGLVARDGKTNHVLGDGGTTLSRSDDNNWYVMGVGPYQDGSMKREIETSINSGVSGGSYIPNSVVFASPIDPIRIEPQPSRVQITSQSQAAEEPAQKASVDEAFNP